MAMDDWLRVSEVVWLAGAQESLWFDAWHCILLGQYSLHCVISIVGWCIVSVVVAWRDEPWATLVVQQSSTSERGEKHLNMLGVVCGGLYFEDSWRRKTVNDDEQMSVVCGVLYFENSWRRMAVKWANECRECRAIYISWTLERIVHQKFQCV